MVNKIKISNIRKPYVLIDKNDNLVIIYNNRVVEYKKTNTYTKKETDKDNVGCCYEYEDIYGKGWNKEHEYNLMKDNGFKNVGLKE